MATVTVAHHPDLTLDRAMGVFKSHFFGKYDVYESSTFGRLRRVVVKKNAMTGVIVASSWAVRVLPIPGWPASIASRPRPESASSRAAFRSVISRLRPMNTVSDGFMSVSYRQSH